MTSRPLHGTDVLPRIKRRRMQLAISLHALKRELDEMDLAPSHAETKARELQGLAKAIEALQAIDPPAVDPPELLPLEETLGLHK